LRSYPKAIIDCPHWCMSSVNQDRFRKFFDTYPNLYTDISFGERYAGDGFKRISDNVAEFRQLVFDYQDRIMFGTDMVLTEAKTPEFASGMIKCYRDMLDEEQYECNLELKATGVSIHGMFKGLNLPEDILKKIYHDNPENFLRGEVGVTKGR